MSTEMVRLVWSLKADCSHYKEAIAKLATRFAEELSKEIGCCVNVDVQVEPSLSEIIEKSVQESREYTRTHQKEILVNGVPKRIFGAGLDIPDDWVDVSSLCDFSEEEKKELKEEFEKYQEGLNRYCALKGSVTPLTPYTQDPEGNCVAEETKKDEGCARCGRFLVDITMLRDRKPVYSCANASCPLYGLKQVKAVEMTTEENKRYRTFEPMEDGKKEAITLQTGTKVNETVEEMYLGICNLPDRKKDTPVEDKKEETWRDRPPLL